MMNPNFSCSCRPVRRAREKDCPTARLRNQGAHARGGNDGHRFIHRETRALPGTRMSGLTASACSEYNPTPAGFWLRPLWGSLQAEPRSLKPQAHPCRVQVKIFAFVAFARLETKWFLSLFSSWLMMQFFHHPPIHSRNIKPCVAGTWLGTGDTVRQKADMFSALSKPPWLSGVGTGTAEVSS